jgi:hypothetical protein
VSVQRAWVWKICKMCRSHVIGESGPYLHEMFCNLRGPGGYIGCHGGGPQFAPEGDVLRSLWGAAVRRQPDDDDDDDDDDGDDDDDDGDGSSRNEGPTSPGTHRGHQLQWAVPYLSLIVALRDVGPGDGPTVVIPASHKSLVGHPVQQQMVTEGSAVEGAIEVHLQAGDALLFQDALVHGAAARQSEGWRQTVCFRYLPEDCSADRFGWEPTDAQLAQLTPRRRELLTHHRAAATLATGSDVPPPPTSAAHDPWGTAHRRLAAFGGGGGADQTPGSNAQAKDGALHEWSRL